MQTLYLSGKISGLHREEAEKRFKMAYDCVRSYYGDAFEVIDPMILSKEEPQREGESNSDFYERMLMGSLELLAQSDAVAMLPNWSCSDGAIAEHQVAKALGKEIIYLPDSYVWRE